MAQGIGEKLREALKFLRWAIDEVDAFTWETIATIVNLKTLRADQAQRAKTIHVRALRKLMRSLWILANEFGKFRKELSPREWRQVAKFLRRWEKLHRPKLAKQLKAIQIAKTMDRNQWTAAMLRLLETHSKDAKS